MNGEAISIYIMPSEVMEPPRAVVGQFAINEENNSIEGDAALVVAWSNDIGQWVCTKCGRVHLPDEIQEAITERAKELGVKW